MSGLEIERKFLVHKKMDWKRLASSCSHIQQGYFAAVNTVRIRIRDDRGYLTIKGPSHDGGLSRYEFEKEITLEEARQLMLLCEPGVIDKHRYLVPFGGMEVTGNRHFYNSHLRRNPFRIWRGSVPEEYR